MSPKRVVKTTGITRRSFVKGAGGCILTSLVFGSSCDGGIAATLSSSTTIPPASTTATSQSTAPPTSATNSTQPPVSSSAISAATYNGNYAPPAEKPPLIGVPGGDSKVATDRLYSEQHIWVKEIASGITVLGMTDKLQMLITNIDHIVIPMVGEQVYRDQSFSYIEGGKMNVELLSPITGEVLERNSGVLATIRGLLGPINNDPYGAGWMLVVKLNKPAELKDLLTAQEYAELQAKSTPTTGVPAEVSY